MNTQLKKGTLEMLVLSYIRTETQYGYQLAQNISKHISIAEGTLYPLLRRLVKEGYLNTTLVESNEGPARKYYELTEEGDEHLSHLITEWLAFQDTVMKILKETKGTNHE